MRAICQISLMTNITSKQHGYKFIIRVTARWEHNGQVQTATVDTASFEYCSRQPGFKEKGSCERRIPTAKKKKAASTDVITNKKRKKEEVSPEASPVAAAMEDPLAQRRPKRKCVLQAQAIQTAAAGEGKEVASNLPP